MPGSPPRPLPVLVCLLVGALGCAHGPFVERPLGPFVYFDAPAWDDPWTPKIAGWQSREQETVELASLEAPASVSGSGSAAARPEPDAAPAPELRDKYFAFRREQKRAMARDVADWIQREARQHYRPDGAVDHWATLEETLANGGDDCDGLELLVYHFLRDLGFTEDEVYRAIVVRPSDGQHHMVTLWFEDAGDPWVIDPTGAMTAGMPRMSEVPGWVPLKVFSEDREFSAGPLAAR